MQPETLTAIHRAEHDALWAPQISIMSDSNRGYRAHRQNDLLKSNVPINPYTRLVVDKSGRVLWRGSGMNPPEKRLIFAETGTANNSHSQTDDGVK